MKTTVEKSREFAIKAHADQKYGNHPYSYHLDAVAKLLKPFGEQAQIAWYLHDTVEDTVATVADIAAEFGVEMADCIRLLTDEAGENRRIRKAKTHEKLSAASNPLALIVKAADRLANLIESQRETERGKLAMYRREHEAFKNAAYRQGLCDDLWSQMDAIINSQPT